jgi:hypothetical protein
MKMGKISITAFWLMMRFSLSDQTFRRSGMTKQKIIRKVKRFNITEAAPDDPIYTRGFVIGGRYPGRRTINEQGKTAINKRDEKIRN